MSGIIHKRIAALEASSALADEFVLILVQILTPGATTGEAALADVSGQRLSRGLTETEDAFIERIRAFAQANRAPGQRAAQVILREV